MPTLTWRGKDAVLNHHLAVPYHVLRCDGERSAGTPGSGNLIVEGDNLLALKALLPYYKGQVKCIFIDPPYNTGEEKWSYNDNVNSPEIRGWLHEIVGQEGEDLSRHDKWLCMMWPRLSLLKEFLHDSGSIWITLDDNEVHHGRLICDEIFRSANFVATVAWQKSFAKKNKALISGSHDHILCYAKNKLVWERNLLPRDDIGVAAYKNPDLDHRGLWQSVAYSVQSESAEKRTAYRYPIRLPSGREVMPPAGRHWNGLPERTAELRDDNRLWFGPEGNNPPRMKAFLNEVADGVVPDTWWTHSQAGSTQDSKKEMLEILHGTEPFPTPKPEKLLGRILAIATKPTDLILDSFAGSGTTAHAALKLNADDGGNRRFILVEMDRKIATTVTAERVRRVATGYTNAKGEAVPGLGGGFRYCTLGTPLFDAQGGLNAELNRDALAHHLFFTETGEPLPHPVPASGSLIGSLGDRAIHLLYDPENGSVFDSDALAALPPFPGERVVFADVCLPPASALAEARVVFKQIPYDVRG